MVEHLSDAFLFCGTSKQACLYPPRHERITIMNRSIVSVKIVYALPLRSLITT